MPGGTPGAVGTVGASGPASRNACDRQAQDLPDMITVILIARMLLSSCLISHRARSNDDCIGVTWKSTHRWNLQVDFEALSFSQLLKL